MLKFKSVVFFGLIFLCCFGIYIHTLSGIQQKSMFYFPESYEAFGFKGLQLFLDKHHYSLTRTAHFSLAQTKECYLIVTREPLKRTFQNKLWKWVHSGGTLIELAEAKPVFTGASTHLKQVNKPKLQYLKSSNPAFRKLNYLTNREQLFLAAGNIYGLYGMENHYLLYSQNYGRGKIISWNDPDAMFNKNLANVPDNAVIFLKVLQNEECPPIIKLMDIRSLPSHPDISWHAIFLRNTAAAFLLIIAASLSLWKITARFGRPRPLSLAKGRSHGEFVTFLAALFQQAGLTELVVDNLYQDLVNQMAAMALLPKEAPVLTIINRLEEITSRDYSELKNICIHLENNTPKYTKKTFLTLAVQIDRYRKEFQKWKRSNTSLMK